MTGTPQRGDLYMTAKGRTVEIVAFGEIDCLTMIASAEPVGSVEVIAYRLVGASVVHLAGTEDVQEWVKIESV